MNEDVVSLLRGLLSRLSLMSPEDLSEIHYLVTQAHIICLRASLDRSRNSVETMQRENDRLRAELASVRKPRVVLTEEIPEDMVRVLNERAGKDHSVDGDVMFTLAMLLTMWEKKRETIDG